MDDNAREGGSWRSFRSGDGLTQKQYQQIHLASLNCLELVWMFVESIGGEFAIASGAAECFHFFNACANGRVGAFDKVKRSSFATRIDGSAFCVGELE